MATNSANEQPAPAPHAAGQELFYPQGLRNLEADAIRERRKKAPPPSSGDKPNPGSPPRDTVGLALAGGELNPACQGHGERAGTAAGSGGESNRERLPDDAIGLALSGGGIRSATFCLGFLQALAGAGQLRKVDFLSTVSGGGYIGAFLGRLYTRGRREEKNTGRAKGGKNAKNELVELGAAPDASPSKQVEQLLRDPNSKPMRWLRESGNYLAPNGLSDFLHATAIVIRDWIINLFLLILAALTAFMLLYVLRAGLEWTAAPAGMDICLDYLGVWGVNRVGRLWWSPFLGLARTVFLLGFVPFVLSYWITAYERPVGPAWALILAYAIAVAISAMWIWPGPVGNALGIDRSTLGRLHAPALLMVLVISLAAVWAIFLAPEQDSGAASGRGGAGGPDGSDAVALARNKQNVWLKRGFVASALLLIVGLIDSMGQSVYAWEHGTQAAPRSLLWVAYTLILGAFGGAAAVPKLLALLVKDGGAERLSGGRNALSWTLAVILLAVILIYLSFVSIHIAYAGRTPKGDPGKTLHEAWFPRETAGTGEFHGLSLAGPAPGAGARTQDRREFWLKAGVSFGAHSGEGKETKGANGKKGPAVEPSLPDRFGYLLGLSIIGLILSGLLGRPLGLLNQTSMLRLYCARLVRAYLGASNPDRFTTSLRIVTPDLNDSISLSQYKTYEQGGPLHVINVTLNETMLPALGLEHGASPGLRMAVNPVAVSVGVRHHARWVDEEVARRFRDALRHVGQSVSSGLSAVFRRTSREPAQPEAKPRRITLERIDPSDQTPGFKVFPKKTLADPDFDMGRWMATSGAAFGAGTTPRANLGLNLLMGLGNVRLGQWWDSGIEPSKRDREAASAFKGDGQPPADKKQQVSAVPLTLMDRLARVLSRAFPAQSYLFNEWTGHFHGTARRHWFLSDGGILRTSARTS